LTSKKIKGFLQLFRFELPFSAGVCVVFGQTLALGHFASLHEIGAGFLSVFFISASALILNDYFDIEIDKVNAPDRPLPSGLVTTADVIAATVIVSVIGLIISYLINFTALLIAVLLLAVGFLYNWKYKKTGLPGNLMVSFSVGMTFVFGGISEDLPFEKTVLFFAIISALINLGEEIAADAMDEKGDKLIGSNSLAIKYGKKKTLAISNFIFFFVVLLSIIPFILGWFSLIYLIPILIMDTAIAYSSLKLLNSNVTQGRKYIRWIYLGALLGVLLFLLMILMGV
jgi:geranylgeranylglycerol-phosphate geranylgeranyltransferase